MEFYKRFIEIVDANLIYCLIPIILTLILAELIFKNRFETKKVLNLIRWIIIIYTLTTFTFYLIGKAMNPYEYAFINRAFGPYAWAYWIMFLSAMILPFSLLVKKLATNFWYVLFIAFCMKIGSYFERFVIIMTSLHRDNLPDNGNAEFTDSILYIIGIVFLQGIAIAILTLGVFKMTQKKKNCA
jgi:hypothetical protein